MLMQNEKAIQEELKNIQKELEQLPSGRLVKKRNFYAHVIDGKEIGITHNHMLIQQLCRRKYLLVRKKQLNHNLTQTMRHVGKIDMATPKEVIKNFAPSYQDHPSYYFYHTSIRDFLTKTYTQNTYPANIQTYSTNGGTTVRSKSELIIANLLEANDIPYCYEIPLKLGIHRKYPDFTIMHPFTGDLLIWEHFGALHQPDYEQKMNEKMSLYLKHGYQPWKNLIYTFEFDLDPKRLQQIVDDILLKH